MIKSHVVAWVSLKMKYIKNEKKKKKIPTNLDFKMMSKMTFGKREIGNGVPIIKDAADHLLLLIQFKY